MSRSILLFGPDGAWFRENSREFLQILGDPSPDYDATSFAVRNLGFVKLVSQDAMVEITLNPLRVGATALAATHHALRSSNAPLVRVRYSERDGDPGSVLPIRAALAKLSALWPESEAAGQPN